MMMTGAKGRWVYGSLAAHVQGVLRANTLELKKNRLLCHSQSNRIFPLFFICFIGRLGLFAGDDD